jgi:hypothetical protein
MVEELEQVINRTAKECCSLMSEKEREKFFKYQEKRIKSGDAYPAKYRATRTYYKGKNKGKVREIWNVDGFLFTKLWNLVKPYAYQSSYNSRGFDQYMIEEDLSEIKLWLFKVLRFYGPEPMGVSLFKAFPSMVVEHFTNAFNAERRQHSSKKDLLVALIRQKYKRLKKDGKSEKQCIRECCNTFKKEKKEIEEIVNNKTPLRFSTVSLYDEIGEDEVLLDTIPQNNGEDIYFSSEIPKQLQECASLLLGGESLKEVSKKSNIALEEIREQFSFYLDLCV